MGKSQDMDTVKIICVFGDSLAWGAWDRELGGWINRLRIHLDSLGLGDSSAGLVYNLGIETNTTNDLLSRFENEARERFWETQSNEQENRNVCIFEIGKNDSQYRTTKDAPWVPVEVFEQNIVTLIEKARVICSHVYFVGLAHVDESKTIPWDDDGSSYDNENVEIYNAIVEKVCLAQGVRFVKILDLLSVDDLVDGVHPHAVGHQKIFVAVRDVLTEDGLI